MRAGLKLPHEAGGKTRVGLVAVAIAVVILGCFGADLLGYLMGLVFGWA